MLFEINTDLESRGRCKIMENMIKLFGAAGVLALICVGLVALLYPIMFDIKFKENFGKNGISYWWAAIQMISTLGTMSYARNTSSDEFTEALGFTVIIFVIAMIRNYKRIKKMGLEKSVCRMAVLAQAMAPVGIFLILILVSNIFKGASHDEES